MDRLQAVPGPRPACFTTPLINRTGKYIVRGFFDAHADSPFEDSDNLAVFFVRPR